jgi:hypothetical protein
VDARGKARQIRGLPGEVGPGDRFAIRQMPQADRTVDHEVERGVHEIRDVRGAAALVDEPDYGRDAEIAQHAQALIRPGPVWRTVAVGSRSLPQHGIAHRPQSDLRKAAQVIGSDAVTGNRELVHVGVPDAVDGCFDAAPEFEVRRQCAVVTHSGPRTKKRASNRAVPRFFRDL